MQHRQMGWAVRGAAWGLLAVCALTACDNEDDKKPAPPLVGLLELPLSHRNTDRLSDSATRVEIGPTEIRVGGARALTLSAGKVGDSDRKGHLVPALHAKLSASPSRALALVVHGATPYATLARVLHTGLEAGVSEFFFQVRKPAATTETGWMRLNQVRLVESIAPPVFELSEMPAWEQFSGAWREAHRGCKGDEAGDCGYVPSVKAKGGKLEMLLRASGVGIALRFRQFVPDGETGAEGEESKPAKAELMDGVAAAAAPVEEKEDPSTEANFSLRADRAARPESPVSAITQPVCGQEECAAVVASEGVSLTARVLALIGAAFPDGTPQPKLALSLPKK